MSLASPESVPYEMVFRMSVVQTWLSNVLPAPLYKRLTSEVGESENVYLTNSPLDTFDMRYRRRHVNIRICSNLMQTEKKTECGSRCEVNLLRCH